MLKDRQSESPPHRSGCVLCPSMRQRKAFTRPDRGVVLHHLYSPELVMNPVGQLMLRMVRRCLL